MKRRLSLTQVESGMLLAEDIVDKNGNLIIEQGNKISQELLRKIRVFTEYSDLLVSIKSEIGVVVEKDNGTRVELKSSEVEVELKPQRVKLQQTLDNMTKTLESSFAKLNVNGEAENSKRELDRTVKNIRKNVKVNVDLLEEIVSIKDIDDYLYVHSLNVAMLSFMIGKWLGMGCEDLDILILSGILHDIGKLGVDQDVLNKPGRLTEEEFEEIKKHPVYSHNMIKKSGYTDSKLLKAVTFHHEKQDGSGYPLGISGEQIPIHARILAIADIFDAMTSNRVYKKRVSPFKVLEMFQNQNFGKLDVGISMLFVRKFAEYYVGSKVELNNGERGKIITLNHYEVTKPLIRKENGDFVDISKSREVEILDFI